MTDPEKLERELQALLESIVQIQGQAPLSVSAIQMRLEEIQQWKYRKIPPQPYAHRQWIFKPLEET